MLKLERGNTASLISFDDTMDIDRAVSRVFSCQDEPDSNDEDDARERYRVEIVPTSCVLVGSECGPGSSAPASSDRRAMFAKSKSVKTCYSMPVPVSTVMIIVSSPAIQKYLSCVFNVVISRLK